MTPEPPAHAAPLILHVFPTFAVGGAQIRFAAIANHFGRRFRHAVIAMDGNTACRGRLDPSLDLQFPVVAVRKGGPFDNIPAFRKLLRDLSPHTLVTSNWGAMEWAIANAWPMVRHVHMEDGFGPEEAERQLPRRVWTRRLALRRSTVLLPSLRLRHIAIDVWRLPRGRVHYVPNGVDLMLFSPAEQACATMPVSGGRTIGDGVIGTVAALRAEKNVGRLIGAFARVAQTRRALLIVVGDGPERDRLQRLAAQQGVADRVRFAGHLPDPVHAYHCFNIFALSSDTEQMPLSVLEAMASGLPVAATDVGDIRSMVSDENAPMIVPKDEAALAGAITRLLDAPDRARAIGQANRAKAERDYDQHAMFAAHEAAWLGATPASA